MRVGIWNFYTELSTNNFMLRDPQVSIGDELLQPFNLLAETGRKVGVEFITLDLVPDPSKLDAIIFVDRPASHDKIAARAMATNVPQDLILFECPVVKLDNWHLDWHRRFRHVYTWADDLVGGENYRKINFARPFPATIPLDGPTRSGFAAMIAGNKWSTHGWQLYGERISTARWFGRFAPTALDLYGPGWDGFRTWRGTVQSKRKTLQKYRFSICYENARGFHGYITEKILDCLCAGTIPVYWGAPNVSRWIPPECFIDRRAFASHAELYDYLADMAVGEHAARVEAIRAFVTGAGAQPFRSETFVSTILDGLFG